MPTRHALPAYNFPHPQRGPTRIDHARNWFLRKTKRIRRSSFSARMRKPVNWFRITLAFLVTCWVCFGLRQRYEGHGGGRGEKMGVAVEAPYVQNLIWRNCEGLEALRDLDECYESSDLSPSALYTSNSHHHHNNHNHASSASSTSKPGSDNNNWLSSYNAVLSYDASYTAPTIRHPARDDLGPHYTTRRTIKCLTGSSMSIVWSLSFETPLAQIYDTALRSRTNNKNSPSTTATTSTSCPLLTPFASNATLGVKINCGFDVHRDAWGNPLRQEDHDAVEKCTRMAWTWVKERMDVEGIEPWGGVCAREGDAGEVGCRRGVFGIVGGG